MIAGDCKHGDVVAVERGDERPLVRLMMPFQFGGWLCRPVQLDPYREGELGEFVGAGERVTLVRSQADRNNAHGTADRSAVRDYVMGCDDDGLTLFDEPEGSVEPPTTTGEIEDAGNREQRDDRER